MTLTFFFGKWSRRNLIGSARSESRVTMKAISKMLRYASLIKWQARLTSDSFSSRPLNTVRQFLQKMSFSLNCPSTQ